MMLNGAPMLLGDRTERIIRSIYGKIGLPSRPPEE